MSFNPLETGGNDSIPLSLSGQLWTSRLPECWVCALLKEQPAALTMPWGRLWRLLSRGKADLQGSLYKGRTGRATEIPGLPSRALDEKLALTCTFQILASLFVSVAIFKYVQNKGAVYNEYSPHPQACCRCSNLCRSAEIPPSFSFFLAVVSANFGQATLSCSRGPRTEALQPLTCTPGPWQKRGPLPVGAPTCVASDVDPAPLSWNPELREAIPPRRKSLSRCQTLGRSGKCCIFSHR